MMQFIQAIYEHGVFRPLETVALPEHERVVLTVSETTPPLKPAAIDVEVLGRQRNALAKMRAEMDALPCGAPRDGLGGADHDLILYGWKK